MLAVENVPGALAAHDPLETHLQILDPHGERPRSKRYLDGEPLSPNPGPVAGKVPEVLRVLALRLKILGVDLVADEVEAVGIRIQFVSVECDVPAVVEERVLEGAAGRGDGGRVDAVDEAGVNLVADLAWNREQRRGQARIWLLTARSAREYRMRDVDYGHGIGDDAGGW